MKKHLTTLISIIFILILTSSALSMNNSPIGFRGITWGTKPEEVQGLTLIKETDISKIYSRESDRLTLGETELTNIQYEFHKKYGFYKVILLASGPAADTKLASVLSDRFGVVDFLGMTPSQSATIRFWADDNAKVYMNFSYDTFETTCAIASTQILKNLPLDLMALIPGYKFENRPEDFNGIKWGASPEEIEDLELIQKDDHYDVYIRKTDSLTIDGIEFKSITYRFDHKYGFYYGDMIMADLKDYERLKKELLLKYNAPRREGGEGALIADWFDDNVRVTLWHIDMYNKTEYRVFNVEIFRQRDRDQNKKRIDKLAEDF